MLNPISAANNPSSMASSRPCHQVWAPNTSRTYEPAKPARRTAVFTYICQQSRCRWPVVRKCSSTRRRSSRWKALSCPNLRLRAGSAARRGWPAGPAWISCSCVIAPSLDYAWEHWWLRSAPLRLRKEVALPQMPSPSRARLPAERKVGGRGESQAWGRAPSSMRKRVRLARGQLRGAERAEQRREQIQREREEDRGVP